MIKINDINTYPESFKEFCNDNIDCLNNTIRGNVKEFHIDSECYLFNKTYNILEKEEIELIQASRLVDKNDIIKNGILNPALSNELGDIILKPISKYIGKELFLIIKSKMREIILEDEKYNKVHFVIGEFEDISMQKGFWMLEKYGGELLEDVFSILQMEEYYNNNIKKTGEPYAIFFKQLIKNLDIHFQTDIISFMLYKCVKNTKDKMFSESYIFNSIEKKDIVCIKKVNLEE